MGIEISEFGLEFVRTMTYKLHCTTVTVILLLHNYVNPRKPFTKKANLTSWRKSNHSVSKRNLASFIDGGVIQNQTILPGWKDWEKDELNESYVEFDQNLSCQQKDRDSG